MCFVSAKTANREHLRVIHQDDFQNIYRARTRHHKLGKDMESSKRFLLQAEIEYWHEMLRLNKNRIDQHIEKEMRDCLKHAVRSLNTQTEIDYAIAA